MSFSTSLQLLMATGSTQPWRKQSVTMPIPLTSPTNGHAKSHSFDTPHTHGNGAVARRYGSSPILSPPPNDSLGSSSSAPFPDTSPKSTPPTSRRISPTLNSRSTLASLPAYLLHTRGLLVLLCFLHTAVVVGVLLWLFSPSASSSASSFTSAGPDGSPFSSVSGTWNALLSRMDLTPLRYSSPASTRALNSAPEQTLPAAAAAETSSSEQSQPTPDSSQTAHAAVVKAVEAAQQGQPDQTQPSPPSPPLASATPAERAGADSAPTPSASEQSSLITLSALTVPFATFFHQLQHEHCADSSSAPVRSLVYSCSANTVHLEHADELYEQHSLAGLYAVLRAATLASASNRTLLLDDSQCGDVRSLAEGAARDAGVLCCEWRTLFQPVSPCALPGAAASMQTSSNVRAWGDAAVVQYDAQQQCMWEEEVRAALRTLAPTTAAHALVRSLAAQLFRPSTQLAATVSSLSSALPTSALTVHVPPFTIEYDRSVNHSFASAIPLRMYADTLRMHALTLGRSFASVLAAPDALQHLQQAVPQLALSDVWTLARQAANDVAGEVQWAAVQASVVLWAASQSDWWLGVHQSVLTQLAAALSSNVSVLDVSGDRWMPSCWSASAHTLSAEIVLPRAYNLPALSSLTTQRDASTSRIPLVLVLGSTGVGVPLLDAVLADRRVGYSTIQPLSESYASLFRARDYTVPDYQSNRTAFIEQLKQAAATPLANGTRGILLQFARTEKFEGRERALIYYHHASFLAQLTNNYQLPLSLHVLVVARDPASTLRSLMSGLPAAPTAQVQTRVLTESRLLRDVVYGVEAETAALDLSVYRVFNHERLWRNGTAREAERLAAFLQLPADAAQRLVEALTEAARDNQGKNFPPPPTWNAQEEAGVTGVYTSMSSLQLFNHEHPVHRLGTYDYHKSFAAALATVAQQTASSSFGEQLTAMQEVEGCKGPLLLFDGFIHWRADSSRASSQLLDVVRSLTLALATGRTLVVPPLAGSVLERLVPLSACRWETAALGWQIAQQEGSWTLMRSAEAQAFFTDAVSAERVVMTHSPVLDLAYLAAWNAKSPERSLGVHHFIRSLLVHLLRPVSDVDLSAFTAPLLVSIPQIVSQPASYYVGAIRALLNADGYSSMQLVAAPTPFAQLTTPSFLPHADDTLLQAVADSLRRETTIDVQLGTDAASNSVDRQLAELLYALNSRSALLGSLGTEDGFVLASLADPSRWSDLFGYQYLPSLLSLNHHTLLHSSAGTEVSEPYTPMAYRSTVVLKSKYSDRCRFVFVAGVEGTGHHGIGNLLTSLRQYRSHSVPVYKQLDADDHLSQFIWKMFGHQSYTFHERAKKQLTVRIAWRISQSTRNAAPGEPMVVVINGIRENEGGMMSYPNTDFEDKAILHPSLQLLAQMFEANNADLRVVALTRSGGSSLASTVKREHAVSLVGKPHAFYYQARVLRSSLAALAADMAALDPAFVTTISMEMIYRQPELVGRALSSIMAYDAAEMTQACIRMREEAPVAPGNHWRLGMNTSELQLADDMLGVAAYLPFFEGGRLLQAGSVGGRDVSADRSCRALSIRPRAESRPVSVLAIQGGGGASYLQQVVEESTGVLVDTHRFDRNLPPSTRFALPSFVARSLTAFTLTELPLEQPAAPFDLQPSVILTRNPLDVALAVSLPELMKHPGLSGYKLHDLLSWRGILWRNTYMGPLTTLMTGILGRVAEQYVSWMTTWKVAERRKQTLDGVVGDGVVVLRLEDLVGGGEQQLTGLLDFLRLTPDNASLRCVQAAKDDIRIPPRLLSPAATDRTLSNNLRLSSQYSSLQQQLLLSAYPPQGTGALPVAFLQLITHDAFKAFRAVVDETAAAVEGSDWARYVSEIQPQLEAQWTKLVQQGGKIAVAAAAKRAAALQAGSPQAQAAAAAAMARASNPKARALPAGPPLQSLDEQVTLATRELENQKRKLGASFESSREALKAKQRLAQLQALLQRRQQGKLA